MRGALGDGFAAAAVFVYRIMAARRLVFIRDSFTRAAVGAAATARGRLHFVIAYYYI